MNPYLLRVHGYTSSCLNTGTDYNCDQMRHFIMLTISWHAVCQNSRWACQINSITTRYHLIIRKKQREKKRKNICKQRQKQERQICLMPIRIVNFSFFYSYDNIEVKTQFV